MITVLIGWAAAQNLQATVVKAYDGDTLTLSTGDKVRLSWVNSPELRPAEPFGAEAGAFTRGLTLNKTVTLIVGEQTRDGYGRLLAGVMVEGTNLSLALVEKGLAHVFVIPPEKYDMSPLLDAQEKARAAKLGIWSTPSYAGDIHITSFHANAEGDDAKNVNGESLRLANLTSKPLDLQGWVVSNRAGRTFELAQVVIPPGQTAQVRAGHGAPQTDPARQLVVHLGSDVPVFDNDHDVVTLYDKFERVVDTRTHGSAR